MARKDVVDRAITQRAGNTSVLELVAPFSLAMTSAISVLIDGGGAEIADAVKVPFGPLPDDCTISAAYASADQDGAIVVDVWASSTWIPTDSDSITASAPITITATGDESTDTTLTGWTTSLSAGDRLIFNVDSCTTITWCLVTLTVERRVS
jgi:hypothetical protein